MYTRIKSLLLAVLLLAPPTIAQTAATAEKTAAALAPQQIAELDRALEQIRRDFGVPGLAVGILENGEPVYAKGFGVRDSRSGDPVTANTLFHVASLSKVFTATAILQLVEEGVLQLDGQVEQYLPDFAGSGITLTQLLTHSAGLADRVRPSSEPLADYVQKVSRNQLAYPPGQGWGYSDADFNILGAVIEKVSGKPYSDYMRQRVLVSAGMVQSAFDLPREGEIAWPHPGELFILRGDEHPWNRIFAPSSGLQTSVANLLRWAQVNLRRDPALLTEASYRDLFGKRLDTNWHGVAMGLGWQLEQRDGEWLPRHPGGDHGFRALLTLYPHRNRAIVILSNGETTPRWEIRGAVEAILAGAPPELPQPPAAYRYRTLWISAAGLLAIAVLFWSQHWRRRRKQL